MKFTCNPEFPPTRKHDNDAGIDLMITKSVTVHPHEIQVVSTEVCGELPPNTFGMVAVRSSVGLKGIGLANTPAIIDEGYRGEIKLALINNGRCSVHIPKGDRVAQLIVVPYVPVTINIVDSLNTTERGTNGFGSTGQ